MGRKRGPDPIFCACPCEAVYGRYANCQLLREVQNNVRPSFSALSSSCSGCLYSSTQCVLDGPNKNSRGLPRGAGALSVTFGKIEGGTNWLVRLAKGVNRH